MPIDMKSLARVGAEMRLRELLAEVAEIRRAFPGIGGQRGPARAADKGEVPRRRRRPPRMSAAQKKAVSERMRKYWAARRKTKKG
jgi:hypothetical protein